MATNETENNEIRIFTLEDEEGNEHEFELLDTCERNGTTYYAMAPTEESSEDPDDLMTYVILKSVVENGEETLVSVDDDDEFDDIADYFDDRLVVEIDHDEDPS